MCCNFFSQGMVVEMVINDEIQNFDVLCDVK